jgi:hypothetical protein
MHYNHWTSPISSPSKMLKKNSTIARNNYLELGKVTLAEWVEKVLFDMLQIPRGTQMWVPK